MSEIRGFEGTEDEGRLPTEDSGDTGAGPQPGVRPPSFQGHLLYVHECGNQSKPSVVKGNWDACLFGHEMGDRSRLAYWVNTHRYAFPLPESAEEDAGSAGYEGAALKHPMDALEETVDYVCPDGRRRDAKFLLSVGKTIIEACGPDVRGTARGRADARQYDPRVVAWLQAKLLPDLLDYFFDDEARRAAENAVLERVAAGAGPYIILAHGMGSIVAYNALRTLTDAKSKWKIDASACKVKSFITMGSPLGIPAIVKELQSRWGELTKPSLVKEWVDLRNAHVGKASELVSHSFPVDSELTKTPVANENPHSGESYLRSDEVKNILDRDLGMEFGQAVADFRIAKDMANLAEDSTHTARHDVLIEYADLYTDKDESQAELRRKRAALIEKLTDIVGKKNHDAADISVHRRYVSARLTRHEMEQLAAIFQGLNMGWIWRDATKSSLLNVSVKTVQALPARLGYQATGKGIAWAVLDTGVDHEHPHFNKHGNLAGQWDCTQNTALGEVARDSKKSRKPWDVHGHGTHVAATIAGCLEDLKRGGEPFPLYGIAPETKIYSYKVLADNGNGRDSFIIRALDDIAEKNRRNGELVIHGVNLSLGGSFDPSVYGCGHSPICRELRRLWRQGVVVCLAAGNEGLLKLNTPRGQIKLNRDLSIADPANLDVAIAVGSSHKSNPHTYGVSHFSSRGPTADGRQKPDLVAPGERILSARTRANPKSRDVKELYVKLSGTSMACPHVSGVIAAFLSQRSEFIGYPERIKKILLDNCTDLERDVYFQGRGMPNLVNMLLKT